MGDSIQKSIIDGISELIRVALICHAAECSHPQHDADRMDDTIKFYASRANNLRSLRVQLEDELARVVP